MALPVVTPEQLTAAIPELNLVGAEIRGGQKLVFPCEIAGQRWALKVMLAQPSPPPASVVSTDSLMEAYDPVTARARREVAIMGECESDHLVKLGPLPLSSIEVAGQNIIYFTEEWIIGEELTTIIRQNGRLSLNKVVTLGLSVADAIDCLWSKGHVHRDVKPGNIMERSSDGEFVLLDMGFAFDVSAESISAPGAIPGTMIYFSPEQADVGRKRQLDFRSDLFALGLVMYEALTGSHPFTSGATSSLDVLSRILTVRATPPSSQSSGVSKALDEVILRLLAKAPHLRYRSCAQLMETIRAAQEGQ